MDDCKLMHETIVRDLVDLIDTVGDVTGDGGKEVVDRWRTGRKNVGSIAKRASNLVLVFPVIVSSDLTYGTAALITKALESKCVTLLRILFSSINYTNINNMQDYIAKYHKNLTSGLNFDDFLADMDRLSESGGIEIINKEQYDAVMNDLHNINYTLESALNPIAINDYHQYTSVYGEKHITLDHKPVEEANLFTEDAAADQNAAIYKLLSDEYGDKFNNLSPVQKAAFVNKVAAAIGDDDSDEVKEAKFRAALGRDGSDWQSYFTKQVISNKDALKANELEPTMMTITFNTLDDKTGTLVKGNGVIGVKCKMYPVDSMELVNRISSKYADSNTLFNLIRASTREISFLRDLVFAIDKAKIDAINMRKESNNAKMFKILERRARGRHNKLLTNNDASPITSMVISQNEVEYLRKYCNLDITKPSVAKVIMNNYNLLAIVVADESLEIGRFLYDDDSGAFETLTFDSLSRDQKDTSYKKIVNLMSKVAR